ncbi:MAG: PAS domain-containing protein [Acidimicrobiales bacterium]|nr:PAS domain-containing protein [Acidimicrobiales bacterium]
MHPRLNASSRSLGGACRLLVARLAAARAQRRVAPVPVPAVDAVVLRTSTALMEATTAAAVHDAVRAGACALTGAHAGAVHACQGGPGPTDPVARRAEAARTLVVQRCGAGSRLGLPLTVEGAVVAVVTLDVAGTGELDGAVRDNLLALAHLGALACDRIRLVDSQRQTVEREAHIAAQAELLRVFAADCARSLSMAEVLHATVHALVRLLRPASAAALLACEHQLQVVARSGASPLRVGDLLSVAAGGSVVDAVTEACAGAVPEQRELPLLVDGEVLGVLALDATALDAPAEVDRAAFEAVVLQATEALRRARLLALERNAVGGLQRLSRQFERVFVHHPVPVLVCAAHDGTVLAANDALRDSFGYDEASLRAGTWRDLVEEDDWPMITSLLRPALRSAAPAGGGQALVRVRRQDRSILVAEPYVAATEHFAGRDAFLLLLLDQTRRVEAERARRRLEQQIMEAAEEGRRRLAEELHDGPVQHLSVSAMRLSFVRRTLVADGGAAPALLTQLEQVAGGLDDAVRELRTTMTRLYTPQLERCRLGELLRDASVSGADGRSLLLVVDDRLAAPAPAAIGAVLYRIAMEALRNVGKHAQATTASVTIDEVDGSVRLVVQDDGVGIDEGGVDVDALRAAGHIGLLSMRSRVLMLGGTWQIRRRSADGGTVLTVTVPLDLDEPAEGADALRAM